MSMAWGPDGFLYAGGAFEGVWYWDGQDWVRIGDEGSQPHDIYALASDGTTLLAGGSFFLTGARNARGTASEVIWRPLALRGLERSEEHTSELQSRGHLV